MLDRIREAVFSTLAPWLATEGGPAVLDLFSGSGLLGFEALSRGARRLRMVEQAARAAENIEANAEALGALERIEVIQNDALDPAHWGGRGWADIVFFDPPYPMLDRSGQRRRLFHAVENIVDGVLADEGVLVFHTPRGKVAEDDFADGIVATERIYGTNSIWYIQFDEEDGDE